MWNAGKVAYYEKDKIQMTLMTLNPGYGIGYPQNSVIGVTIVTQELCRGLGDTPRNAFVDIQTLC